MNSSTCMVFCFFAVIAVLLLWWALLLSCVPLLLLILSISSCIWGSIYNRPGPLVHFQINNSVQKCTHTHTHTQTHRRNASMCVCFDILSYLSTYYVVQLYSTCAQVKLTPTLTRVHATVYWSTMCSGILLAWSHVNVYLETVQSTSEIRKLDSMFKFRYLLY